MTVKTILDQYVQAVAEHAKKNSSEDIFKVLKMVRNSNIQITQEREQKLIKAIFLALASVVLAFFIKTAVEYSLISEAFNLIWSIILIVILYVLLGVILYTMIQISHKVKYKYGPDRCR